MRFWIKIIVAFSVIVVLGFGAWAFFFKEKDEVVAYNRVSELVDYKESLNLFEQIEELSVFNYINGENGKEVIDDSSDNKSEILSIRETTMSEDLITYYDAGGNQTCTYDSYIVIEQFADDMIKYLMPYLKYTNSSDVEINSLKTCIDDYIVNLQELINSIDMVNKCQSSITGTEIEFEKHLMIQPI